jgi:hypothetical protein
VRAAPTHILVHAAVGRGVQAEAEEFDFFPLTFSLPGEGALFTRAFKEHGGVWIMKPVGRAQGKGIFLVNKLSQIEGWLKVPGPPPPWLLQSDTSAPACISASTTSL